jgi:hypothetical protein
MDSVCQFSSAAFVCGAVYLVVVVVAFLWPVFNPITWDGHVEAYKHEWSDVWVKARARHWTAPFFILGLPVVGLLCLPILLPWAAWSASLGVMLLPQLVCLK